MTAERVEGNDWWESEIWWNYTALVLWNSLPVGPACHQAYAVLRWTEDPLKLDSKGMAFVVDNMYRDAVEQVYGICAQHGWDANKGEWRIKEPRFILNGPESRIA